MARRIRWIVVAAFATAAAVGAAFLLQGFGARGPEGRGPSGPSRNVATVAPPALAAAERAGPSEAGEASGESADTPAAPEGAAPASAGVWRGRVLNSAGAGLASAEVGIVDGKDHAHVRAVDADGTFAWPYDELPADPRTVFARCDGFVTSPSKDLRVDDIASFVLEAGVRIAGRVVAARTGAPIVGATVHVADDAELELGDARDYGNAVTDAVGNWPLMDLPPRRFVRFRVAAEGFGVRTLRQRVAGPTALEVRLDPEGVVTGVVVDEQGRPCPGVGVIAVPDDDRNEVLADGTSSAAGEFELRGLPRGVSLRVMDSPLWSVQCPDTDMGTLWLPVASSGRIVLTDAEPRAVTNMVVTSPASLRVTVSGPDGVPVRQGLVFLGRRRWAPYGALVDGVVEFPRLAAGKFELRVTVEGFDSVEEPMETVWGQRTERTICLRAPSYVAGMVEDEQGRPLAGASVSARSATTWDRVEGVAGEDGRFRLDGVAAADPALRVECPGRYVEEIPPLVAPVEGLRIVARPLVVVRGRVVPPPGRTLGRFTTTAAAKDRSTLRAAAASPDVQWQVPPGTWTFTISDVVGCLDLTRDVTVAAGSPVDLGDLRLVEGAIVEGVVMDTAGVPVAGAGVLIGDASATSDASGSFRIEGVDPRRGRLSLGAEGYAQADVPVGPADLREPLRVILERPGRLRAFLRLEDERSWRGEWSWRARREGSDEGTDSGNDDRVRRAVVSELRPGAYRFELWFDLDGADSSTPPVLSIPFRIEEGKDTELEVVIPAK